MKRKIFTLISLICLAIFSDCAEKPNEKSSPDSQAQVAKQTASSDQISRIANFIKKNKNENQSLQTKEFPVNQLTEIAVTIDGVRGIALGIESTTKNNKVLVFKISGKGDIVEAFITDTELQKDGSVSTKYYSLGGVLFAESVYSAGKFTMRNVGSSVARTSGWWDRTGDCVSKLAQPFDNGIYNLLFDAAATYVTSGWYPAVLVAACAIKEAEVEPMEKGNNNDGGIKGEDDGING